MAHVRMLVCLALTAIRHAVTDSRLGAGEWWRRKAVCRFSTVQCRSPSPALFPGQQNEDQKENKVLSCE